MLPSWSYPLEAVEKLIGWLLIDEPIAQAPLFVEVEVVTFWELELPLVDVCSSTIEHSQP